MIIFVLAVVAVVLGFLSYLAFREAYREFVGRR
jgi:hypothetical protein